MATIDNVRLAEHRILAVAIIFSLAWHLLWLSIIKVVPAKARPSQVSFSKVSFLGPILSRVSLGVRSEPVTRSFLEKRYASKVDGILYIRPVSFKQTPEAALASDTDRKIRHLVDDAVSGSKIEPEYELE